MSISALPHSRGGMMARPDVTVFGAGVFGLSVAWACAQRGATVHVCDPAGVAAGASGGLVGALSPHAPEKWNAIKAFQFDSLVMAAAWWRAVAEASGRDPGYARCGRLQPVADDGARDLALARGQAAATLWQGAASWRVVPQRGFASWAPDTPTGWLIHDTLSARIHPLRACQALAAAIGGAGGRVTTTPPDHAAPRSVEATGAAGLAALSDAVGRAVGTGVKGQAALLWADPGAVSQIFAGGLHVVPHDDGTVAIGSTSERDYDDPTATDDRLDDVVARARALCPALAGAPVVARWAGVRPRARTRAPILGAHPTQPATFVANGGFKIGFGVAPKVGEVMADLVLTGHDAIPDGLRVTDAL